MMDGIIFIGIGAPLVAFLACSVYRLFLMELMDWFPGLIPMVRASSLIVLSLVPIELTLAILLDRPLLEYRFGAALVAVVFWLSPPALAGLLALPPAETRSNTGAAGLVCAGYAMFCLLWTGLLMEEVRTGSPHRRPFETSQQDVCPPLEIAQESISG